MSFWDPYDRYGRERRRRMEQRRRAGGRGGACPRREEEARARAMDETRPRPAPSVERFEQELAQARRERDEWADRYKQAMAA